MESAPKQRSRPAATHGVLVVHLLGRGIGTITLLEQIELAGLGIPDLRRRILPLITLNTFCNIQNPFDSPISQPAAQVHTVVSGSAQNRDLLRRQLIEKTAPTVFSLRRAIGYLHQFRIDRNSGNPPSTEKPRRRRTQHEDRSQHLRQRATLAMLPVEIADQLVMLPSIVADLRN